jgi:cholesterol oxidase
MDVKDHEVIVIGSGFGGSFVAHELAKQGREVCVLERGRKWLPGEFPRRPDELFDNVWAPPSGRFGLFDFRAFRGLTALVAAGVGGGSLIYANVLLDKPGTWFTTPVEHHESVDWPISADVLRPYYERARKAMTPKRFTYPASIAPRTAAFEWAAQSRGYHVFAPELAVSFSENGDLGGQPIKGPKGTKRETCRLCGECILGCNFGAKNTLDLTLLDHDAINVRAQTLVRSIAPIREGDLRYAVRYIDLAGRSARALSEQNAPIQEMRCRVLVIAAGALGSPELMLRSASSFPGLSRMVGTHFSPNGDLLTFGTRIGGRRGTHQFGRLATGMAVGPTITRSVVVDAPGPDGQRFYLQDSGLPVQLAWLLLGLPFSFVTRRTLRSLGTRGLELLGRDPRTRISDRLPNTVPRSRVTNAFAVLGMGIDTADGQLRLRDDQLQLRWKIRRSRRLLRKIEGASDDLIRALGGRTWPTTLTTLNRIITVHPVGGMPMGSSVATGVVDDRGEVHGWNGLFVIDGSAMPGAVGPNPSMTIAAFALRASERVLERLEGGAGDA